MIRGRIQDALKGAMRARDEIATTTFRMINAAIKQKDIDVARARGDGGITDEEILGLLQSLIKSRRESIVLYRQGHREDLADKENSEIAIIEAFLPRQMTEEETETAISAAIAETGATGIKDMGKVMAALKANHAGIMDMGKASAGVKHLLGGT